MLTIVKTTFIFLGVQLRFSFPQFHIFSFVSKSKACSNVLHQAILSLGQSAQSAANILNLSVQSKSVVISHYQAFKIN